MDERVDIKENRIIELDDNLLSILLKDHSSNKNIIWATDNYQNRGQGYQSYDQITIKAITGRNGSVIKPRISKSKQEQLHRVKDKAEVFTPSWICNEMANAIDEDWFDKKDVFNKADEKTWQTNADKISFPEGKTWQDYVSRKCLEITCGEVPFLVSRYDTTTGEWIEVNNRIGVLDRKLRVVCENTCNEQEWIDWVYKAYKTTFGYEWQGDSLLIARENLLYTFIDYYENRFNKSPNNDYLIELAKILSWNIWQMDGLKYVIPNSCKPVPKMQMSIFEFLGEEEKEEDCPGCVKGNNNLHTGIYCKFMNWETNRSVNFMKGVKKMKFDFVIGNPPYQDVTVGEQKNFAPSVYNFFMDSSYNLADKVMFITPARFLFNAGNTSKDWNKKMLSDNHLKVVKYFVTSKDVFPNTDVKGGISVTYHDNNKQFEPIGLYIPDEDLRNSCQKVKYKTSSYIIDIIYSAWSYRFTERIHTENPNVRQLLSNGHDYDVTTNSLEILNNIVFFNSKPNDDNEYIKMFGIEGNKRVSKWIKKSYIDYPENFENYKVAVPKANGSGAIGEVLSTPLIGEPLIGEPLIGFTPTFMTFGSFKTQKEAESCMKYLKSKFSRAMLGTLKRTQDNPKFVWSNVPLQDFTEKSDIDWSKTIHEIDEQLYKKYGLDDKEIEFIESHVQEME